MYTKYVTNVVVCMDDISAKNNEHDICWKRAIHQRVKKLSISLSLFKKKKVPFLVYVLSLRNNLLSVKEFPKS
jgi:hypothetical protein